MRGIAILFSSHAIQDTGETSLKAFTTSGNGKEWMLPTGWSCYTSVGDTKADLLAEQLCLAAEKHLPGHRMRCDISDGDHDQERDFYILRNTLAPAVLSENLFIDAKSDYEFLLTDEGRKAIVDLHVEGIIYYLNLIETTMCISFETAVLIAAKALKGLLPHWYPFLHYGPESRSYEQKQKKNVSAALCMSFGARRAVFWHHWRPTSFLRNLKQLNSFSAVHPLNLSPV